jgi:Uma2 family endonuclease
LGTGIFYLCTMGAAKRYSEHYTIEEWANWKDRWELIDGMPYCMSPAPTGRHQRISVVISRELENAIRKRECKKCKVYQPVDWQISDDTVVEPDLIVLCKTFLGAKLLEAPIAIFEILSPSTKNKDRTVKFDLYQSQKVKHYTMVDPETETVEIYTIGEDGLYQKADPGPEFIYSFDDCKVPFDFRTVWED